MAVVQRDEPEASEADAPTNDGSVGPTADNARTTASARRPPTAGRAASRATTTRAASAPGRRPAGRRRGEGPREEGRRHGRRGRHGADPVGRHLLPPEGRLQGRGRRGPEGDCPAQREGAARDRRHARPRQQDVRGYLVAQARPQRHDRRGFGERHGDVACSRFQGGLPWAYVYTGGKLEAKATTKYENGSFGPITGGVDGSLVIGAQLKLPFNDEPDMSSTKSWTHQGGLKFEYTLAKCRLCDFGSIRATARRSPGRASR